MQLEIKNPATLDGVNGASKAKSFCGGFIEEHKSDHSESLAVRFVCKRYSLSHSMAITIARLAGLRGAS